jgi:hypothetical protein
MIINLCVWELRMLSSQSGLLKGTRRIMKIIHTDDHKLMRMGVKNAFFTGGSPERDSPYNVRIPAGKPATTSSWIYCL